MYEHHACLRLGHSTSSSHCAAFCPCCCACSSSACMWTATTCTGRPALKIGGRPLVPCAACRLLLTWLWAPSSPKPCVPPPPSWHVRRRARQQMGSGQPSATHIHQAQPADMLHILDLVCSVYTNSFPHTQHAPGPIPSLPPPPFPHLPRPPPAFAARVSLALSCQASLSARLGGTLGDVAQAGESIARRARSRRPARARQHSHNLPAGELRSRYRLHSSRHTEQPCPPWGRGTRLRRWKRRPKSW